HHRPDRRGHRSRQPRARQAAPAREEPGGLAVTPTIAIIAKGIDAAGVLAIVGGGIAAILVALVRLHRVDGTTAYRGFRHDLGRGIITGLELLVAADIVHTINERPTLTDLASLAIIVAIRTALSFSLAVELDGRWPWQQAPRSSPE